MKTLNLNKLTILISLFLISVVFSSGAQANSCVKDANNDIRKAGADPVQLFLTVTD